MANWEIFKTACAGAVIFYLACSILCTLYMLFRHWVASIVRDMADKEANR